jgi:putative phosphoribosyl transferase
MRFRSRPDAGCRLAEQLQRLRAEDPLVVGLARGGVPVAAEVAGALGAPLDVLVVRKLGCPWQPELGVGAIGEDGVTIVNRPLVASLGLTPQEVEAVARRERAELERRLDRYRAGRPAHPVEGRTVILVDDGMATGSTARAAVRVLRARGARRVVVAVPVASAEAVRALGGVADEVVALRTPTWFLAVGQFYEDFAQTTDQDVTRLLATPVPGQAPVPAVPAGHPRRACQLAVGGVRLGGDLVLPVVPSGMVVFAHGSGSSRHSPRNRFLAGALNQAGLGTLLLDLLTPAEEFDRANVFDVELLADRLLAATSWLRRQPEAHDLPVGYFGAGTGAAAALLAAADRGGQARAVVCRSGRPDLAWARLARVRAPTLLIVAGDDEVVGELNQQARKLLRCDNELRVVAGAGHLFEEPGALTQVAALATGWFTRHLARTVGERPAAAQDPLPAS